MHHRHDHRQERLLALAHDPAGGATGYGRSEAGPGFCSSSNARAGKARRRSTFGWMVGVTGALLALTSLACGGSSSPPKTAAPPVGEDAVPSSAREGSTADQTATQKLEEQHRTFVQSCSSKATSSADYCECAWMETRKSLSDDELMNGRPDVQKLEGLRTQISSSCSAKLPEEAVKQGFQAGCVGDRSDMQPYCDCSWSEYRKNFSPAELASEEIVKNDRFLAARKSVVATCASQMPESVAKEDFMNGCARDPKAGAFCTCAWTELRKMANAGEIEAGTFDRQAYAAKTDKACGKLKPSDGSTDDKSSSGASGKSTSGASGASGTTGTTGKSTTGKSTSGKTTGKSTTKKK